jgi:hypothetical protein
MADKENSSIDIVGELNNAKAILVKDLERMAKYAAIAERFSRLSADVELPDNSLDFIFGFSPPPNATETPEDKLGKEVRDNFASYSARFSVVAMITAFEIFILRVLWIAKLCGWMLKNGDQIPTTEFYRLGEEARKKARHTSVQQMITMIGEYVGKSADFPSLEWFKSIYAARRCLTHRGGIVGPEDANEEGKLRLVLRKFQLVVDDKPQDQIRGLFVKAGSKVGARFISVEREIPVGESLVLTPQDCQSIAFSIVGCADDLVNMVANVVPEIIQKQQTISSQ